MLNKKSVFKPKAALRRPASGAQAAQRPGTAAPSKTPVPPDRASPPTQQQPAAPRPTPSVPDVTPTRPENNAAAAIDTSSQADETPAEPPVAKRTRRESRLAKSIAVAPQTEQQRTVPKPTHLRSEAAPSQSIPDAQQPVLSEGRSLGDAGVNTLPASDEHPTAALVSLEIPATPTESAASAPASDQAPQTCDTTVAPASELSIATKPTRGRKRTVATATPATESGDQLTTAPSKKKVRRKAAPLPGEEGYKPAQTAGRTTRSRKRSRSVVENGEPEEDGEGDTAQPKGKPAARAQREATPPDAENVEIDITQVKMADLAKDMHIGKKFSLHDELMERERAKRLRYNERRRRRQTGDDVDDDVANEDAPAEPTSTNPDTSIAATPATTDAAAADDSTAGGRAPIGEQYQIIDGEIVLDHRSLQVDRHARAREEAGHMLEVEENDFTHHTTSATYLRRNLKPQQWTDEETDLFYQALSAFGTDFDTICRMFRGKTRKHIKLKFNREERLAPARINAALVGQKTVSIDMEQYQRATGQAYEPAEAIYAEQRRAEEEFEARQKALEDEKAEEVRRKKEEVLAQLSSAVEEGGAKKRGRGGKKKAAKVVGL